MENEVLVIGYGSIGKRHVKNLLSLKIKPFILTSFPDEREDVFFVNSLDEVNKITHTIIATPTAQHLSDFIEVTNKTDCKKILIEKPIESSFQKSQKLMEIALNKKIDVNIGYNMRFLEVFTIISKDLEKQKHLIRLVKIYAGQYLPEWRPSRDYRKTYSAHKNLGGGVELDLSHELDYMLWLFGTPINNLFIWEDNLSKIDINSTDFFKGLYKYPNFIVDIELDYFRKKNRGLEIIGENENIINVNFIEKKLKIRDKNIKNTNLFDFNRTYVEELNEFLEITPKKKICTIREALRIYKLISQE